VRRYTYAKTVRSLLAPASYRATVRFRWLDADGQVLDQDDAVSAVCIQDDLRPDLVPRRIDVQPAAGTRASSRYGVLVRNAGATASGAFGVRLDVPGLPSATATATGARQRRVAGRHGDRARVRARRHRDCRGRPSGARGRGGRGRQRGVRRLSGVTAGARV
jgi:hypothetical protein